MILDSTGRGSKPSVTEKTLTLISDPLDEDRLLISLVSVIRDSIRMCTNDEYNSTNKLLLFWGKYFERKMNFSKREVHQPKYSDFIDVVYAFDVPRVVLVTLCKRL